MEHVTVSQEEIRDGHRGDLSGTCSREVMAASKGTAGTGHLWEYPRHERTHSRNLYMPEKRLLACTFPEGCKHTQCRMHQLPAGNQWDNPGKCGGGDTHPSSVGRTGSTAQEMGWRSHPSGFGGGCVFVGGENLSSFLQTGRSPLRCGFNRLCWSSTELIPCVHGNRYSKFWEAPVACVC